MFSVIDDLQQAVPCQLYPILRQIRFGDIFPAEEFFHLRPDFPRDFVHAAGAEAYKDIAERAKGSSLREVFPLRISHTVVCDPVAGREFCLKHDRSAAVNRALIVRLSLPVNHSDEFPAVESFDHFRRLGRFVDQSRAPGAVIGKGFVELFFKGFPFSTVRPALLMKVSAILFRCRNNTQPPLLQIPHHRHLRNIPARSLL